MSFGHPGPGQRELVRANGLTLEERSFYLGFLRETGTVVVEELRNYFQRNPHARDYRWRGVARGNNQIETADDSPIGISFKRPDRLKQWPYIVVRSVRGNLQELWLGKKNGTLVIPNQDYSEFAEVEAARRGDLYEIPEYLEVGERLGGSMRMDVVLEVGTVGGPHYENDTVADLIILAMARALPAAFAARNMTWVVNSQQVLDEIERPLQGDEVNIETIRPISFSLWNQWYQDFYYTAPTVDEIEIERVYIIHDEPEIPTP